MPVAEADALSVDWTITDSARAAFARFSGDHNPIHTDPVAARRLHGGRMLVHGAHLLLTAIDQAESLGLLAVGPLSIDARFLHGVEPDRALRSTVDRSDGDTLTITVWMDVWRCVEIRVGPADERLTRPVLPSAVDVSPRRDEPDEVAIDDLTGRTGGFVVDGLDQAAGLFPHAVDALGATAVTEIASLSRVVGMHVPGRRSLSSRYRIRSTTGDRSAVGTLVYAVSRVSPRTRRVEIDVTADHVGASIEAFSPAGPVEQRQVLDGAERPDPGEFDGRRVLVVGGSRGLGAASVELLRAGGAEVRGTGRHITDPTGAGDGWTFDATHGAAGLDPVLADGWRPTSVCWFATPPYGDGVVGVHSERHAAELHAVQVDAFVAAVDHLRALDPPIVGAFWPSCEPRTSELREVKLAGEAAAAALRERWPELTVLAPRLPTMLTDQTRSLLPIEYADTARTLLGALRALPG